jgi:hypothetical protein
VAKLILVKADLAAFLVAVAAKYHGRGRILLIGETSHVWEGFTRGTNQLELVAEGTAGDGTTLSSVCAEVAADQDAKLLPDSPADFVPLPDGFEDRVLVASDPPPELNDEKAGRHIALAHFDPYSVAIRFIARGDEPDYHLVLTSLSAGWVVESELERMLADLLDRFTLETIQQDPAEFRRKYKGLIQIWRAARPGLIHRFTEV